MLYAVICSQTFPHYLDLVKGSAGGVSIYDLVTSGINYLDTRTDFWRQQKPMYARKRDRQLMQQKWSNRKADQAKRDPTKFILRNLDEIDKGRICLSI